ncbi:MAG TPA: PhoH family protein [Spirochaetales bacterium]|nr:PhoH family protein [Spirochaetales bacterium]HRY56059.1 PhoH family protein [Spirochaetia bacterium]HRZ65403.1 PhoH family protein [Spirochaetia bacterium]
MDATVGIVLDDTSALAEVCGANDYNLRVMERLVGSRIFCRGNELFLESDEEPARSLFRSLVERLLESMAEGLPPTPDLIIAIYADLTPEGEPRGSCGDFLDSCVQIPGGFGKVFPRSRSQALYLKGLASHDLSFAVGPAGTGKTYLAVAWALRELLTKSKRKLVLTRPVVEAGESLGFLPGDLAQKISPYLRPLYDSMEALVPFEVVRRLEESRAIEIAPLAYMRGRSLSNCVVILDEAQNTTKEQMKMFLTRLGENSRAVVTGDVTQIDLPRKGESGLVHALQVLSRVEDIFVCRLDSRDVVRSGLVRRIIEAYESE